MVEINSNTAHAFTALPTEEQVEEEEEESSSITLVGTTDQILDGLLSKVGYGLFQKKLLVSFLIAICLLDLIPSVSTDIMWIWMVGGQCKFVSLLSYCLHSADDCKCRCGFR